MSLGAQVPCVKGPIYSSDTQGGGGGVHPRLLSFVGRAMAIAQLTQLLISVPASGAPPGQVPEEWWWRVFMGTDEPPSCNTCIVRQ